MDTLRICTCIGLFLIFLCRRVRALGHALAVCYTLFTTRRSFVAFGSSARARGPYFLPFDGLLCFRHVLVPIGVPQIRCMVLEVLVGEPQNR